METLALILTVLCLLEFAGLVYYQRLAQCNHIKALYWRAVATAHKQKARKV